jgi:hypothetical protein
VQEGDIPTIDSFEKGSQIQQEPSESTVTNKLLDFRKDIDTIELECPSRSLSQELTNFSLNTNMRLNKAFMSTNVPISMFKVVSTLDKSKPLSMTDFGSSDVSIVLQSEYENNVDDGRPKKRQHANPAAFGSMSNIATRAPILGNASGRFHFGGPVGL